MVDDANSNLVRQQQLCVRRAILGDDVDVNNDANVVLTMRRSRRAMKLQWIVRCFVLIYNRLQGADLFDCLKNIFFDKRIPSHHGLVRHQMPAVTSVQLEST